MFFRWKAKPKADTREAGASDFLISQLSRPAASGGFADTHPQPAVPARQAGAVQPARMKAPVPITLSMSDSVPPSALPRAFPGNVGNGGNGGFSATRVVTDPGELPRGTLISGEDGELPLGFRDREAIAVLRTPGDHIAIVVASESWGSNRSYAVRLRVRRELGCEAEFVRADMALVRMCYSRHDPNARKDDLNAVDATDTERLARTLLQQAVELGASDLHIETRTSHADVYARINGLRQRIASIGMEAAVSVGRVLYTVHADSTSKEEAWDPTIVQDAVIEYRMPDGLPVQLRFSSGPIYPAGNFHIVIRVLKMNQRQALPLEDMGYSRSMARSMDVMLSGARGLVLLAGPTNSGKSTSMQALIGRVYARRGSDIKIITAEDPVEYIIPGACQMGVPAKRRTQMAAGGGSMFTSLLKGTLRQDADVVMVGEIRDTDSAAVVKDLVLTGRKVFTTLHAYGGVQAFVRLREIGVPWDVLTTPGFVSGVIYQRLLPVLCPHCAIPVMNAAHAVPGDVLARLEQVADMVEDKVRVRGEGCEACRNTGYVGRTVCAETIIPDGTFLRLLASGELQMAEQYWMEEGRRVAALRAQDAEPGEREATWPTALGHAITKMRAGVVDPADVEAHVELLTRDAIFTEGWSGETAQHMGGIGSRLQRQASRLS